MFPNYRLWWQKPALHPEGDEAKRVTFLELFTDLIFVVVIARLAHHLIRDSSDSKASWEGRQEAFPSP